MNPSLPDPAGKGRPRARPRPDATWEGATELADVLAGTGVRSILAAGTTASPIDRRTGR